MYDEILEFLDSQPGYTAHDIIPFLKASYSNIPTSEIKKTLVELEKSEKLSFPERKHIRLGDLTRLGKDHNEEVTLDNWQILAKMEQPGKDYLAARKKQKFETEKMMVDKALVDLQYQDYPLIRQEARQSLTIAKKANGIAVVSALLGIAAIIVAIVAIVVTHNDTEPVPFPFDTTAANTRIYEFERRLQAIEKAKALDTAAPGTKPANILGTIR